MAFIRIKKIKGNDYAYLVKNIWNKKKKHSTQKVNKYLGRVIKINQSKKQTFDKFIKSKDINTYLKNHDLISIYKDLISLEVYNHGFKRNKKIWKRGNLTIDLDSQKILEENTPICVEINNNFFCSFTLNQLLDFKIPKDLTDLQLGKTFANIILSTGISLNNEFFLKLFEKFKEEKNLKNKEY